MDPHMHRIRVTLRPHDQPPGPYTPTAFALPHLPDGCPADMADWPARDGRYTGPHTVTVCPTCLPRHRRHATVSDPRPVPTDTPMIYAVEGPDATCSDEHPLLALLRGAGLDRMAFLPLPGLDDDYVLVADHPARGSRATVHSLGIDLHLARPDGTGRVHIRIGPRIDPTAVIDALHTTGHPIIRPPRATPSLPPLPPGARYLSADDAIYLIITGDHVTGADSTLARDGVLVAVLRSGWIHAAQMPDGTLTFIPHP